MLALADETLIVLVGMLTAWGTTIVGMVLRARGKRRDSEDALLALGRAAALGADDVDSLDALHRRALQGTSRPKASEALDTSMRIVLSESQRFRAFGKD